MSVCILPLKTLAATEGPVSPHSPGQVSSGIRVQPGSQFTPRLQTGSETPVTPLPAGHSPWRLSSVTVRVPLPQGTPQASPMVLSAEPLLGMAGWPPKHCSPWRQTRRAQGTAGGGVLAAVGGMLWSVHVGESQGGFGWCRDASSEVLSECLKVGKTGA